jgi:hypothetical protein
VLLLRDVQSGGRVLRGAGHVGHRARHACADTGAFASAHSSADASTNGTVCTECVSVCIDLLLRSRYLRRRQQ